MSAAEESLALQLTAAGLTPYERQHKAIPGRKFAFDFAWLGEKVACEVDGAIWTGGRHSRGGGILTDCEKYSLASGLGWRVVRVTPQHVNSGKALEWITRALLFGRPEVLR